MPSVASFEACDEVLRLWLRVSDTFVVLLSRSSKGYPLTWRATLHSIDPLAHVNCLGVFSWIFVAVV